jgi:protein-S-isoprenylcysteine O-methyltransferase Ste14
VLLLLKNLLFTFVVPGTVAIYVPLLVGRAGGAPSAPSLCAGAVVLAIGAVVYTWCVWDFASFGRGTPAPIDAPKRLVVRGLYRFTRNPMYVGVLTVIVGWAVVFRSPALMLYGAGIWCVFHSFVRLYEEPHLRGVFGAQYDAYCRHVGRWLPLPQRRMP